MSAETYNIEYLSSKEILKQEIQKHALIVETMVHAARDYSVCSKWSAEEAVTMASQAKSLHKRIEESRKEAIEPHRKFIASLNDTAKVFTEKLEQVDGILKGKIGAWKLEQQRAQEAAEREAKELAKATNSVVLPPVHEPVDKLRGDGALSYEKIVWEYSVEDLSIVPRDFLRLDEDKVKAMVNAGVRDIPGLKVYQTKKTIIRSR